MTTYVIVPWDAQSFVIDASRFPELQTLEEVARRAGPADCVVAFENGRERALTKAEQGELRTATSRL